MMSIRRAYKCISQARSFLVTPSLPIRTIPQLRHASSSTTASSSPKAEEVKKVSTPEEQKLDFDAILKTLGGGQKRNNSKYQNNPPPNFLSKDTFATIRRPIKESGPFSTYAGRTKAVVNGDISGAFKALNSTLRNNSVARDYRTQKFYEKPSNKRVRLNRERHRKRFLSGVKRLVNLVKEQRKFL